MKSIKLNMFVLLTSSILGLVGCAESQFSSTPEVQAKASSQGLRVADVVEDGEIDQEEQAEIEDHLCGNKKVLVCHHPAGDPAKMNEICISTSALKAHVSDSSAHEDTIGECELDDSSDYVEVSDDLSEDVKNPIGGADSQSEESCDGKKESGDGVKVVDGQDSVVISNSSVLAQSGSAAVKFRRAK